MSLRTWHLSLRWENKMLQVILGYFQYFVVYITTAWKWWRAWIWLVQNADGCHSCWLAILSIRLGEFVCESCLKLSRNTKADPAQRWLPWKISGVLSTPTATFPEIFNSHFFRLILWTKFEVRSFTRSWDNSDCSFGRGLRTPNVAGEEEAVEGRGWYRSVGSSYRPSIVTFPLSLRISELLPLLCSSTSFSPYLYSPPNFPMFPWE